MYKLISSVLAVVVTVLSIAIMAVLVDDSKLTAQQVGQYRAENFVVIDDVFDFGLQFTGIVRCTCRWMPERYEGSKFQVKTPPQIKELIFEQSPIVSLLKLNNEIKGSLVF